MNNTTPDSWKIDIADWPAVEAWPELPELKNWPAVEAWPELPELKNWPSVRKQFKGFISVKAELRK